MRHSRSFIRPLAFIALLLAACLQLSAQGRSIPKGSEAKTQEAKSIIDDILPDGQKYRYRTFNGLNLSVDIFDPVLYLFAFDHASFEAQVMADIHNRFFPMASFGMGLCDEVSNNGLDFDTGQKQECRFKSQLSPFGKVGMAYNLNYNDLRPQDSYLIMARYALAYNQADISNLYYAGKYFGAYGPVDILDQKYTTQWLEVGGMIKVQIAHRFSMGWDLYWKIKLSQSGTRLGAPYFVPGYGTADSPIGFSFRLYYNLF